MEDLEIEVEYQSQTIGKYGLGYNGTDFLLLSKQTAWQKITASFLRINKRYAYRSWAGNPKAAASPANAADDKGNTRRYPKPYPYFFSTRYFQYLFGTCFKCSFMFRRMGMLVLLK